MFITLIILLAIFFRNLVKTPGKNLFLLHILFHGIIRLRWRVSNINPIYNYFNVWSVYVRTTYLRKAIYIVILYIYEK